MLKRIGAEEGGEFKAVASGTLPSGKPVVVNADGTVSVVGESALSIGATSVVNTGTNLFPTIAYDTNSNRVVIAYGDSTNYYGKAVVGTVSGGGVSFGTPVVFNYAMTTSIQPNHSIAFDSNSNKVVIVYKDNGNSNYGTAIVGTVDPSDNSISFGSEAVFESAHTTHPVVAFDSSSNKVLISYKDYDDSQRGKAIVGTISGTSISFGSAAQFSSSSTSLLSTVFDSSNNKVIIAYRDVTASNAGKAVVATISGTSVSFGTAVQFDTNANYISASFDSDTNKVILSYLLDADTNSGQAVVGTVSGTAISFGTPVTFASVSAARISSAYDTSAKKTVVFYRDGTNSDLGKVVELETSGTSLTTSSIQQFSATTTSTTSSVYDPDNNVVVTAYIDEGNTTDLETVQVTGTTVNLTSENYIGMSTGGTVADTGNATIDIVGTVNKEQSGLTAGQQYFVQTNGTIGTTAADPSVLAGTAISATELLVKT